MNRAALATELETIVGRVRRNVPRNSNPDAFHEEKSEIANDVMAVVNKLRSKDPLD